MTNIFPDDFVEKVTPAANDKILLADSADSDKIKYGKYSTFKWEQGDPWLPGISWLWVYLGTTAYAPNDAVSYNGSSYVSILAGTWNLPTNLTYWDILAAKGTDGAGSGDVIWPASAVDNNIAVFGWITGKLIKDSGFSTNQSVSTTDAVAFAQLDVDSMRLNSNNLTTTVTDTDLNIIPNWTWRVQLKKETIVTGNISATNLSWTNTGDNATNTSSLALVWGTMTGKIIKAGTTEVWKTYTPATGAQTVALDCSVNNIHVVSWHASGTAITFTVANATSSQPFIVSILQGGTTVSTITAWFATIRWAWGTAPTLTATLNKRDTFWFIRTWVNTYDGFIIWQNC